LNYDGILNFVLYLGLVRMVTIEIIVFTLPDSTQLVSMTI